MRRLTANNMLKSFMEFIDYYSFASHYEFNKKTSLSLHAFVRRNTVSSILFEVRTDFRKKLIESLNTELQSN